MASFCLVLSAKSSLKNVVFPICFIVNYYFELVVSPQGLKGFEESRELEGAVVVGESDGKVLDTLAV